jgi:hypothetical protein
MEQRHLAKREYKQAHRSNGGWLARALIQMSGITDFGREEVAAGLYGAMGCPQFFSTLSR